MKTEPDWKLEVTLKHKKSLSHFSWLYNRNIRTSSFTNTGESVSGLPAIELSELAADLFPMCVASTAWVSFTGKDELGSSIFIHAAIKDSGVSTVKGGADSRTLTQWGTGAATSCSPKITKLHFNWQEIGKDSKHK